MSAELGVLIFTAILLHKIPEGVTIASIMIASGNSSGRALGSVLLLGASTVMGVLLTSFLAPLETPPAYAVVVDRVRRAIARIQTTGSNRVTDPLPQEVQPMVEELNDLIAHNERQAEEARRHAGNLAHALKTPLTVITNAATAKAPDLADTVCREALVMRRQVDHHLARARAIGRRASAQARALVWESLQAVQRALDRLYENVTVDIAGDRDAQVRVERQDLDEMIGNLVENAAKYGGGRVFVTVEPRGKMVDVLVEDDGPGIPLADRGSLFSRGARLDTTGKPGTGLGLAIVRDVAQIYGGSVALEESEDLGGLLARLRLPLAG